MKNEPIDENEILAVLDAIAAGTVTVLPPTPLEHYSGIVEHKTSSGWTFWVFDDCGEWDYIEAVQHPDGRHLYPWEFLDDGSDPKKWSGHWTYAYERLRDWRPEYHGGLDKWPTW